LLLIPRGFVIPSALVRLGTFPVEFDRLIGRVDEIDVAGRRRRLGAFDRLIARSRLDVAAVWKRLSRVVRGARRQPGK
jgi:hypothetical protein